MWSFSTDLTGSLASKHGGDSWWIFSGPVSHKTKHDNLSTIFKNSVANSEYFRCELHEDPIFTPPPTPEFLTKDSPSATRSRMEILTKENLVGAKTAPTAISRTFTPLARRISLPYFLCKDFSFWTMLKKQNRQTWGLGLEKWSWLQVEIFLRSSKRHLRKGRSWILLEFHLNFRNFTRILLEIP